MAEFSRKERYDILTGVLTVSHDTYERAFREYQDEEAARADREYGRVEGDDDPDSLSYGGR